MWLERCTHPAGRPWCITLSLSLAGGTLPQFAWSEASQSFLFALQWTTVTMFSTHVTMYHHLISQAGWNRCNLSIYLPSALCGWNGVLTLLGALVYHSL